MTPSAWWWFPTWSKAVSSSAPNTAVELLYAVLAKDGARRLSLAWEGEAGVCRLALKVWTWSCW